MNIGMILDKPFPPDPRVENEAVTLIQHGHNVFLYCFDFGGNLAENETFNGINVRRVRLSRQIYKFSALAYTIPFYHLYLRKSLSKFLKNNKIDVIHIHDMQVAKSVFSVNRAFNLPIVLDLHENRPEIMKFYEHVRSKLGRLLIYPSIWKKVESEYIKKAQKVIVVTETAKQYYLDRIKTDTSKFYVVPNTVRKAFYSKFKSKEKILKKYSDDYVILYLGDTGLRRGIELLIRSLKYLIKKIPNIKLVIVGKGKSDRFLESLIEELGYEPYVDLLGWQDASYFSSYIYASKIGVSPLHKNIHHETTYANKIFMYLSLGKPIVVSDCEAQAKIVEDYHCGLVFKDRDAKDFSNQILKLYNDRSLYNSLSINAEKAIKQELNWEIMSKELVRLYKEL
jgi:glycosyltransferase involved in cell wall biosynthesis